MYQVVDINEDNKEIYAGFIPEDLTENVGRSYYRFILIADNDNNSIICGMVWIMKHLEEYSVDTESNIIWIRCDDNDYFDTLMEAYATRAKEEGAVRSHVFIPVKDGKEMKALLSNVGFNMRLAESDTVLVKLSELSAMPLMKKMKDLPKPERIMPLNQLTMRSFRKGISKCISQHRYGLCEDLSELGIYWFEDDVSCVSAVDNGINGFFLLHKRPSGVITCQLFVCLDKSFKTTLPYLMGTFVSAMLEKYDPDTLVELDRHNEQTMLLAEKIYPRGIGIPIYSGTREEHNI